MQAYNEDAGSQNGLDQRLNQGSVIRPERRSDYLVIERGMLKDVVDQNGNPVDFVTYLMSDISIPYRRQLVERALITGGAYEENDGNRKFRFYTERVSAVLPGTTETFISRPGVNNKWLDEQMNANIDRISTCEELRKYRKDALYRFAGLTKKGPDYQEPLRIEKAKKIIASPKDNLQGMETSDIRDYMSKVFPALWR